MRVGLRTSGTLAPQLETSPCALAGFPIRPRRRRAWRRLASPRAPRGGFHSCGAIMRDHESRPTPPRRHAWPRGGALALDRMEAEHVAHAPSRPPKTETADSGFGACSELKQTPEHHIPYATRRKSHQKSTPSKSCPRAWDSEGLKKSWACSAATGVRARRVRMGPRKSRINPSGSWFQGVTTHRVAHCFSCRLDWIGGSPRQPRQGCQGSPGNPSRMRRPSMYRSGQKGKSSCAPPPARARGPGLFLRFAPGGACPGATRSLFPAEGVGQRGAQKYTPSKSCPRAWDSEAEILPTPPGAPGPPQFFSLPQRDARAAGRTPGRTAHPGRTGAWRTTRSAEPTPAPATLPGTSGTAAARLSGR